MRSDLCEHYLSGEKTLDKGPGAIQYDDLMTCLDRNSGDDVAVYTTTSAT